MPIFSDCGYEIEDYAMYQAVDMCRTWLRNNPDRKDQIMTGCVYKAAKKYDF